MPKHAITFTCIECGETRNLKNMSAGTLDLAGTEDPVEAVAVLLPEEQVCQDCEDLDEEYQDEDGDEFPSRLGRDDNERFILSGTRLDPGIRAAYLLNY